MSECDIFLGWREVLGFNNLVNLLLILKFAIYREQRRALLMEHTKRHGLSPREVETYVYLYRYTMVYL